MKSASRKAANASHVGGFQLQLSEASSDTYGDITMQHDAEHQIHPCVSIVCCFLPARSRFAGSSSSCVDISSFTAFITSFMRTIETLTDDDSRESRLHNSAVEEESFDPSYVIRRVPKFQVPVFDNFILRVSFSEDGSEGLRNV